MTGQRRAPRVAIALTLLGGVAAIAGALTPWYNVPNGVTVGPRVMTGTPPGWETRYGLIALIAAGAVFVLALLALSDRMRIVLGALIVIAGGIALAYVVLALRDPKGGYIDFVARKAASAKTSAREIRLSLESLFKVSHIHAKIGIGTYATMGGAGLALLGAFGMLIGRRRPTQDAPVTRVVEAPTELAASVTPPAESSIVEAEADDAEQSEARPAPRKRPASPRKPSARQKITSQTKPEEPSEGTE